ncbi:MAG: DUF2959 family protein [Bdellovibrionales bacterium]
MTFKKKTVFTILSILLFTSCSHLYYKSWEILGQDKRDLLVSNVAELKEDQSGAKEEMEDALERIRSSYDFKEGSLERTYDKMASDYKDIESEVNAVKEQLEKVESIASDLFVEWENEAGQLSNRAYRAKSLTSLRKTKSKFNILVKNAKTTEKEMNRTLIKYQDQVLFLKHNLNAKMIGNLAVEVKILETEIEKIIGRLQDSIIESDQFLSQID